MRLRITHLLLIVGLLMSAVIKARAAAPDNLVQPELLADTNGVVPGKAFTVGLLLHIAPNWHVYWINPGDAGAATTLKLTLPAGFKVSEVRYPVPQKLPQPGGLTVYAYEKEVMLLVTVTPPRIMKGIQVVPISAEAAWCVCDPSQCILARQNFNISVPVTDAAEPAHDDVFAEWESRVPIAASAAFTGMDVETIYAPGSKGGLPTVIAHWRWAPPMATYEWLPGPADDLTVTAKSVQTTGRDTTIILSADPVKGIPPKSSMLSGVLAYYVPDSPARGVAITLGRQQWGLPTTRPAASRAGK